MNETEAQLLLDRCDELAAISSRPDALERVHLSPEHRAANDLVAGWMREAGLKTWQDAAGNQCGRLEGSEEGLPALLLGSHIDAVIALPGTVSANVKTGELKVLGVLAKSREPQFPNVPSAAEQGLAFDGDLWRGLAVPKGTPPAVVARLEQAVRAAVNSPQFRQRGELLGFVPSFGTGAELTGYMAKESALIAQLMDKTGLKAK